MLIDFSGRRREGERERAKERNIDQLPFISAPIGDPQPRPVP